MAFGGCDPSGAPFGWATVRGEHALAVGRNGSGYRAASE
jgi:hypothetical protein